MSILRPTSKNFSHSHRLTVEIPLSGSAYSADGWQDAGFVERDSGPITGAAFTATLDGLQPPHMHMTYLDNDS